MTDPEIIHAVGWSLIHFVWQGAALALILATTLAFLRDSRARYGITVCVLATMMIAPVVTFAVLRHPSAPFTRLSAAEYTDVTGVFEAAHTVAPSNHADFIIPFSPSTLSGRGMSWLVFSWFAGASIFCLRTLGGWLLFRRLRGEHSEPVAADLLKICLAWQRRLSITRPMRYLQSQRLDSPAVIGWFRPVVVLPVATLAGLSPWQLEAIIVHELAHIKRLDGFVNLFQIVAEALLFYHPAVWWVNRVIRDEREHCCDDVAVACCGNAEEYARALVQLETTRSTPEWALAATGGILKSRIARLLGLRSTTRTGLVAGLTAIATLCGTAALLAAAASREAHATTMTLDDHAGVSVWPQPALSASPRLTSISPRAEPYASPQPVPGVMTAQPHEPLVSKIPGPAAIRLAETRPPDGRAPKPAVPEQPAAAKEDHSYIGSLQSAGLKNLTVEELIELKIQGVTAQYIRDLQAAGLNASVREIIELKTQGVTTDWVRGLAAEGVANLKARQCIEAKIQGVTPEFVHQLRERGFRDLTLGQLSRLKAVGID